jgi:hypothetical protein
VQKFLTPTILAQLEVPQQDTVGVHDHCASVPSVDRLASAACHPPPLQLLLPVAVKILVVLGLKKARRCGAL